LIGNMGNSGIDLSSLGLKKIDKKNELLSSKNSNSEIEIIKN